MLTNEDIRARVENAFAPLRCVAEIWDYEQKLRLRVFDIHDIPIMTIEEIVLSSFRETHSLDALINDIRQRIARGKQA